MFSMRRCFAALSTLVVVLGTFAIVGAQAATPPKSASGERPELALQLGHSAAIMALSYSPDGRLIASASYDNTVKIWDAQSHELIRTLDGHKAAVNALAWSKDGRNLVVGDAGGAVKFWNPQSGQVLRELPRQRYSVRSLAFSPDGSTLAVGAAFSGTVLNRDYGGSWSLWSVQSGKLLRSANTTGGVLTLAFAPDGSTLALSIHNPPSKDKHIELLEAATGASRSIIYNLGTAVDSLAFSPDGSTLAATQNSSVRLYYTQTGELRNTLSIPAISSLFALNYSPSGSTLAAKGENGKVYIWDMKTQSLRTTLSSRFSWALAYSPDGNTLANGASSEVQLYQTSTQNDTASPVPVSSFAGRPRWIEDLALSPDGRTLATVGSVHTTVELWDATNGRLRRVLKGHKGMTYSVAFSPKGDVIASGGGSVKQGEMGDIILWNARSGTVLQRISAHYDVAETLAFSPNGKYLASGSRTKYENGSPSHEEIKLWDAKTGELVNTWTGRPGYCAALAFSPDNKVVASAQRNAPTRVIRTNSRHSLVQERYAVTLRDVQSGRVLRVLPAGGESLSSVAFSPNGQLVAAAGGDKSVRIWNAKTGVSVRILNGHTDGVRDVKFSPDGSTLVSCGMDNTLRQWDVKTGKTLRVLRGHEGDVSVVQYSRDGKRIISGGWDTTIRFWNARDGRELATLLTAPSQEQSQSGTRNPELETLWLVATPEGYYDCAEGADYLVKWRFGGKLVPFYHFEETYRRPDIVQRALRGERITARPLLLTRVPPAIRFIAPVHGSEVAKNNVRVLVEAADDAALVHSSFAFYVNGVQVPDEVAKPIVVDGKPIVVDGKPITVDGKPIVVDGKPIVVDGKVITADGKPITADGRPITADGRAAQSVTAGSMEQYPFHKMYVLDVPLPRGEEKIVLRAVVTDNEANKSDDAVVLKHLDAAPVKGDLYLVSVGVSHYRNPLYNINYAAADAQSIAGVLQPQRGALYQEIHSTVLSDNQATAKNIRAALSTLKAAGPDDTVMLFLSGHGIHTQGKTYFAPWGVFVRDLPGTCLEWREIVSTLSSLYAKKLLFTDACHSGAKLGAWQATSAQLAEGVRRESGIVMLASSQSDEFSFEDKDAKQGTFSVALAEAFGGQADIDHDGNITLPEIAMYVPRRVSDATKGLQNPQLVLVQDFNPQTVLAKVPHASTATVALHTP